MTSTTDIDDLVEAIREAVEAALDEGQPRIALDLLAILNELEKRATVH